MSSPLSLPKNSLPHWTCLNLIPSNRLPLVLLHSRHPNCSCRQSYLSEFSCWRVLREMMLTNSLPVKILLLLVTIRWCYIYVQEIHTIFFTHPQSSSWPLVFNEASWCIENDFVSVCNYLWDGSKGFRDVRHLERHVSNGGPVQGWQCQCSSAIVGNFSSSCTHVDLSSSGLFCLFQLVPCEPICWQDGFGCSGVDDQRSWHQPPLLSFFWTPKHLSSLKRAQVGLFSLTTCIESRCHWSMFKCLVLHPALVLCLCNRFCQAWIIVLIDDGGFFVVCSQYFKSISHLHFFLVILGMNLDLFDWHFPLLMRVTGCSCLCALVDVTVFFLLRYVVGWFLLSLKQQHVVERWCHQPTSLALFTVVHSLALAFGKSLCSTFARSFPLLPWYHLVLSFPLPCDLQSIALWPHMPHVLQQPWNCLLTPLPDPFFPFPLPFVIPLMPSLSWCPIPLYPRYEFWFSM